MPDMVRVAATADLPEGASLATNVQGHAIALFNSGGRVHAVDNRCPHMAYPLVEATLKDGVLRCPWHHWRFELGTGGCLTAGGDDVGSYDVELRNGDIYVSSEPRGASIEARIERGKRNLALGMTETNTFLIAKALCALRGAGLGDREIVSQIVEHGLRFRSEGFGPGLVILTCLLNAGDRLPEEDRLLALVHSCIHVARDSANRAPRRQVLSLPAAPSAGFDEEVRLFRHMIEDRESQGAERVLITALKNGRSLEDIAQMLLQAATDHYFLSVGHIIDFTNKAYELLDHLGPEHTAAILGSLVQPMAGARRHEEAAAEWGEMIEPVTHSFELLEQRPAVDPTWSDGDLVHTLLHEEVPGICAALDRAVAAGAGVQALAGRLVRAAMFRVARFHLQNENDWDDVLHLVSYCHAVERLAARFGDRPETATALYRAVYHGAMYCYLTRYLNIPAVRLPHELRELPKMPDQPRAQLDRLLYCAEFQQVDEAAALVHKYLADRHDEPGLEAALVKALLREDSVFHTFQMIECGIARHRLTQDPIAEPALVAAARYLTAQRLRRNILWSTNNALTLARGERLHM
ncbi:MAG: Rieske 2Fe-2S domain-containing protein [Armatimonadetes bacterium]|nr:Rieske 2Fe-2S domain-containing protein [Armatimonadota bacterium]